MKLIPRDIINMLVYIIYKFHPKTKVPATYIHSCCNNIKFIFIRVKYHLMSLLCYVTVNQFVLLSSLHRNVNHTMREYQIELIVSPVKRGTRTDPSESPKKCSKGMSLNLDHIAQPISKGNSKNIYHPVYCKFFVARLATYQQ